MGEVLENWEVGSVEGVAKSVSLRQPAPMPCLPLE